MQNRNIGHTNSHNVNLDRSSESIETVYKLCARSQDIGIKEVAFTSLPMEFPQFSFSCDGGMMLEEQMISTSDVHSKTNSLGKNRKAGRPNGIHILQDIGRRRLFRWNGTEEGWRDGR
ncbi:hypothetical protein CDAR_229661 [Caerostris darwini]|uniref:Uncharacterized protein n=1 Tax=Caerostris darwini TaxID=1538125 RepID=A0AAV4PXF4_9ARAC|nr:hypothetical protein CDAR_229661 [Caerostris darwini]